MRILCIGDSNTWGFDPADRTRQDRRWTRLLRTWLKEDEIIEEGCNGRTFAFEDPFTPGRCGLAALPTLLMSHDPIDLVIVMLGTNDLKVQFHANAAAIARGARSFVRTISDPNLYTYGVPSILIVSPILLHEKIEELEGPGGDFNSRSLEQSRLLSSHIQTVCEPYDIYFLDASRHACPSDIDGVHMEADSHEKLARAIQAKIEEIRARK